MSQPESYSTSEHFFKDPKNDQSLTVPYWQKKRTHDDELLKPHEVVSLMNFATLITNVKPNSLADAIRTIADNISLYQPAYFGQVITINNGNNTQLLGDTVYDKSISVEEEAIRNIRLGAIERAINETLNDREKDIVQKHYNEDLTLQEIGDSHKVSRTRIGQLKNKALAKVRKAVISNSEYIGK